jgi:hypothetical protein
MGLGSEIRDPEKTYSGSRIQGSKRHRIPDPDPQHCTKLCQASDEEISCYHGFYSHHLEIQLSKSLGVKCLSCAGKRSVGRLRRRPGRTRYHPILPLRIRNLELRIRSAN